MVGDYSWTVTDGNDNETLVLLSDDNIELTGRLFKHNDDGKTYSKPFYNIIDQMEIIS